MPFHIHPVRQAHPTAMFDTRIRRVIDPGLERMASFVSRWISANTITLGGFCLGLVACFAIALEAYSLGLAFILLNRLADGLDGCVARIEGVSDIGGYLDIVLDIIFYSGVPFAFAIANHSARLPAAFLIYSFVGTGGSFLAYAVISAKRGVTTDPEQRKSFFYSAGLMEGTETVVFFCVICCWPTHFSVGAWIFGTLCWLTTFLRIMTARTLFRDRGLAAVVSRSLDRPKPEGRQA